MGGWPIWQPSCIQRHRCWRTSSICMSSWNLQSRHRKNWFGVLIGESKTAAEGGPRLCDATYRESLKVPVPRKGKGRSDGHVERHQYHHPAFVGRVPSKRCPLLWIKRWAFVGQKAASQRTKLWQKAVECIADIYHRLFILDRPSSIPRIHDRVKPNFGSKRWCIDVDESQHVFFQSK